MTSGSLLSGRVRRPCGPQASCRGASAGGEGAGSPRSDVRPTPRRYGSRHRDRAQVPRRRAAFRPRALAVDRDRAGLPAIDRGRARGARAPARRARVADRQVGRRARARRGGDRDRAPTASSACGRSPRGGGSRRRATRSPPTTASSSSSTSTRATSTAWSTAEVEFASEEAADAFDAARLARAPTSPRTCATRTSASRATAPAGSGSAARPSRRTRTSRRRPCPPPRTGR